VFLGPGRPDRRDLCDLCGECELRCPNQAISISGRTTTATEVVSEALRDVVFWEESGGGLTISGGEPLGQPAFAKEIGTLARRGGAHTALDTSGHAPWRSLRSVAKEVNLVLFDLKHMDPASHEEKTGVGNDLILRNLRLLDDENLDLWIRLPIIPGFNDSIDMANRVALLVSKMRRVRRVDLLPFHPLGASKWKALGMNDVSQGLPRPSDDTLDEIREVIADSGLEVVVG
jgi:pyruvate formate lyase activating enzyme